jgi:hypothetical protein
LRGLTITDPDAPIVAGWHIISHCYEAALFVGSYFDNFYRACLGADRKYF